MRRRLARENVDIATVDEAIAALTDQAPHDRRERDRALGVMLRKGYDPELALDALAAYVRHAGDAEYG